METQEIMLFGCPIDSLTMEQALAQCLEWCRVRDQGARTIITINAGILVAMRKDKHLNLACRAGDLIVADGVPVVWSSRLMRAPLAGRVNGTDLIEQLLPLGAKEKLRIFLLGAREDVVAKLGSLCEEKYPGLVVAGYRNGYFKETDHAAVIEQVHRSEADILFVGMPTPFKEVWCEEHRDEFGVSVIIGVGGSFDVLAGFIPRAPVWMQRNGMEWSWRLIKEPRRMWKRYLVTNTQFILMLLGGMLFGGASKQVRNEKKRGRAFALTHGMPGVSREGGSVSPFRCGESDL